MLAKRPQNNRGVTSFSRFVGDEHYENAQSADAFPACWTWSISALVASIQESRILLEEGGVGQLEHGSVVCSIGLQVRVDYKPAFGYRPGAWDSILPPTEC